MLMYYRYYGANSRKHVFAQGRIEGRIARAATRREAGQAYRTCRAAQPDSARILFA